MLVQEDLSSDTVDLLILGAGWTSTFLIPLLKDKGITFAATSTSGRDGTIKFLFDPDAREDTIYKTLPSATNIVITFPLKGALQTDTLLELYTRTHTSASPNWIQLGSTGIWQLPNQECWVTRKSEYDTSDSRAQAEDRLMEKGGCSLNLAGLWGGARNPRNWVSRVANSKEQLGDKTSLHMIHGQDVARAIVALLGDAFTPRERWMLTDMFVYDWWALAIGWGSGGDHGTDKDTEGPHPGWVTELMIEKNVKALPRSMELLGRCYDTREFWNRFKLAPVRARI